MIFIIFVLASLLFLNLYLNARKNAYNASDFMRGGKDAFKYGAIISALLAFANCFTVVPAGNVGVIDFFGYVSDRVLYSGINFVNPLARVHKFSIKTQELKESMNVPSKEGLTVEIEVSLLFKLNPEKAVSIYKTVGENYEEIILKPQFRSVCRGVTAEYEAKALYTSIREAISEKMYEGLKAVVEERGVIIERALLRSVTLPQTLSNAIESKLRAEQESEQMAFVLQKEKQEAERKRIEAQGISDFQKIITQSINQQLLTWKGIEATEKLSNSQNSKIVVIGSGKNGLPIILNTGQ